MIVHRHGLDESTAFQVEAALIDAYDIEEIANEQRGLGVAQGMPRRVLRDLLEQGITTPEGIAAKLQVSIPAIQVRLGIYKGPTPAPDNS